MNIYLAIITTILVLTQIVRLIQNAIQLRRQNKAFTKDLAWIKDNDISERDFDAQRDCFYLLRDYLEREMHQLRCGGGNRMSVYIKSMEMPTSCCECAIKSWDGEDDVCPFSGISALSIGRQDDCPLVPVPPHGRLIDADALKERFPRDEDWDYPVNTNSLVCETIDNAPTIILPEEGEI